MSYELLKASPDYGKTQKEVYTDLFQETLTQQFSNASDVWSILEESTFASGTYQSVDVRIVTHVINSATGRYLGDDYKQILFPDLTHAVGIGYLYQFDNNYWITTNSEKTKNLAASSTVKRCNNTLRWRDTNGGLHTIPCSIDYVISRNKDLEGASELLVKPQGKIEIICQYNDETNLIVPNQRFLFGNKDNWTAYRVEGDGVNNYNNTETLDNTTNGFIRLSMRVDYVSIDNDDLTNGIAYENKQVYTLTLDQTVLTGIVGNTRQLHAIVTENDLVVSRTVLWSSSSTTKATVSSSGLVTFIAVGTATITCALNGDATTKDTVAVTVSTTPSDLYQVIISPTTNYVLEGETQTYTVYLYKNGTVQADAFTYSVDERTVPTYDYHFVPSTNSFTIKNNSKFLTDYITITCITGSYTNSLDIYLKGSW